MDRKSAVRMYLVGTFCQMLIVAFGVFLLRRIGFQMDYTTMLGMLAIGIGGISSALWGAIVAMKYKGITAGRILTDFVNVKQAPSGYLLVLLFLTLDFASVLIGGSFRKSEWYTPAMLFLKAIVFGGIEEIGWRYMFQPILEEKYSYVISTVMTFLFWGIWHFLYFYIDGSLYQVHAVSFLAGLLVYCFILSALYRKTRSLWICVMTHALINMLSQTAVGGSAGVHIICQAVIIVLSIWISTETEKKM